tara:strand:- start:13168 stop:13395 length:228 start_codon:yes stop_codon:yes gene_type:complete
MNPAQNVIDKFGGVKLLANEIGLKRSAVYKWTYPKERAGTGGMIPSDKMIEIIYASKRLGIDLLPSDFFPLGIFE